MSSPVACPAGHYAGPLGLGPGGQCTGRVFRNRATRYHPLLQASAASGALAFNGGARKLAAGPFVS